MIVSPDPHWERRRWEPSGTRWAGPGRLWDDSRDSEVGSSAPAPHRPVSDRAKRPVSYSPRWERERAREYQGPGWSGGTARPDKRETEEAGHEVCPSCGFARGRHAALCDR
jgi:hypothetical protein